MFNSKETSTSNFSKANIANALKARKVKIEVNQITDIKVYPGYVEICFENAEIARESWEALTKSPEGNNGTSGIDGYNLQKVGYPLTEKKIVVSRKMKDHLKSLIEALPKEKVDDAEVEALPRSEVAILVPGKEQGFRKEERETQDGKRGEVAEEIEEIHAVETEEKRKKEKIYTRKYTFPNKKDFITIRDEKGKDPIVNISVNSVERSLEVTKEGDCRGSGRTIFFNNNDYACFVETENEDYNSQDRLYYLLLKETPHQDEKIGGNEDSEEDDTDESEIPENAVMLEHVDTKVEKVKEINQHNNKIADKDKAAETPARNNNPNRSSSTHHNSHVSFWSKAVSPEGQLTKVAKVLTEFLIIFSKALSDQMMGVLLVLAGGMPIINTETKQSSPKCR